MSGSVKALRIVNLLLGGGLTYSQLNTELSIASSKGAFAAALRERVVYDELLMSSVSAPIVLASSGAMGCVADSNDILDYVIANSTLMAAFAASSATMAAIAASANAMNRLIATQAAFNALMANTVARAAIYASDTALATLQTTAIRTFARALTNYVSLSIANATSVNPVSLGLSGNAIMFEVALNASGNITIANRRAGSTQGTVSAWHPTAAALPGDPDVVALQSTATVATSTASARTSYFGLVYV